MHEQSITVEMEGRHYNLPTVVNGKKITMDQAVQFFQQGKLRPLGQASREQDALHMAVQRSKESDSQPHQHSQSSPLKEALAHQALAEQGSVMAKPQLPQWRQDLPQSLGPTLGTGAQATLNLIDALLKFGPSPLDAAGGNMAQILPTTWKAMAPAAKAMMNQFGDRFPRAFERLLQSPADLAATVTKNMPKQAAGMLRKSTPEKHEMKVRPDYAKEPWTAGHEIQHSLNADRVAGTDPLDALTIGTLMRELLPSGHRGSLDTLLRQSLMTDPKAPMLQRVLGTGPKVVNPQNVDRNVMRGVMDEALAYTAENAARPNADPLLRTLADRLDVRW